MTKSNLNAKISINRLFAAAATLDQIDNKLSSMDFDEDRVELAYLAKKLEQIITEFGGGVEPPRIKVLTIKANQEVKMIGDPMKKDQSKDLEIVWQK